MNKTILITGATSGFGKAIAETFAAAKWNCIITGRRKDRLEALADTLRIHHGIEVLPLAFDVQTGRRFLMHSVIYPKPGNLLMYS